MNIAVCLPTRNEKDSIEIMIRRIKKLGYKLFISDEKSTDGTIETAKKNKVEVYQRDGSGKGYGVRKALEVARKKGYKVLVLLDCDCTYPPEYIPLMLKYIPKYDMVIGRRKMKHIRFLHRLPNIIHTQAINILYGAGLSDINSGMRAFKVDKIGNLDAAGFDIEAQLTIRALKNRSKIKEVPISYEQRKGDSKIRVKDGFVILWRIIKERFRR
ncbi:glycosyltransferase [Candidatus Woesearchaeota archaeon]|nr:glycosyltransferase [Candidatus Woesearchaeota archaeon]